MLKRVLPLGKRGESILGDLPRNFPIPIADPGSRHGRWYWQQTIAARRCVISSATRRKNADVSEEQSDVVRTLQ